jgi:hypothetical protein
MIAVPVTLRAETPADTCWRNLAPKLYIQDETYADIDYVKSEITFVNYVRDRTEADIHLTITNQATGGGGKEYSLAFLGLSSFHDISYTLKKTTSPDATDDQVRKALVAAIEQGLTPYVARSRLADRLSVQFKPPTAQTQVSDPWHNWVCATSLYGYAQSVKSYSYWYFDVCPEIRRTTEDTKLTFDGDWSVTERRYVLDSSTVIARSRGYSASAFCARKLSSHFSVGAWGEYQANDYSNIRLGLSAAPKLEYNLVPYSEYVRHKVYVQYAPIALYRSYFDTTLYDRMSETRFQNELVLGAKLTRSWGSVDVSATGTHYLHDFSKNRLSFVGTVSLQVLAGLSLSVSGGYDLIHDQLSLRKEGASEEERLLRLREMETGYSGWASVNLTYTFGSIYSNIVNPIF